MADRNCANCIHGEVCKKCSPLFGMYGCKDFMEELVRCKDCKHRFDYCAEGYSEDAGLCIVAREHLVAPDHFCGYGERKDDEKENC